MDEGAIFAGCVKAVSVVSGSIFHHRTQQAHDQYCVAEFCNCRSATGAPSEQVLGEHAAILEAFAAGDGEAARSAITAHLEGGRSRLRRAMGVC